MPEELQSGLSKETLDLMHKLFTSDNFQQTFKEVVGKNVFDDEHAQIIFNLFMNDEHLFDIFLEEAMEIALLLDANPNRRRLVKTHREFISKLVTLASVHFLFGFLVYAAMSGEKEAG